MSFLASLINTGMKMSGIKKKYSLPENEFVQEIKKMNQNRGFYLPNNKKAIYKEHMVKGNKCLIVQKKPGRAKRAILYFFGGGMLIGPDKGDIDVIVKLVNKTDMMVDYAFMEKVDKFMRHGRKDVPDFMIYTSKGNLTGVDNIHFVYSKDEVLYGAKQNFIDACLKYNVKYTIRERPKMIHCYAMLPYFREAKEDFDEIAQILAV